MQTAFFVANQWPGIHYGFYLLVSGTVQAELQSDKWGNARASAMTAPLFVKDLHQCSNNTVYKTRENILDKSRKRKETEWMNNCKPFFRQAVFPGCRHFSTTGLFAGFKVLYKPNCSPISGGMARLETSPEERMPEK